MAWRSPLECLFIPKTELSVMCFCVMLGNKNGTEIQLRLRNNTGCLKSLIYAWLWNFLLIATFSYRQRNLKHIWHIISSFILRSNFYVWIWKLNLIRPSYNWATVQMLRIRKVTYSYLKCFSYFGTLLFCSMEVLRVTQAMGPCSWPLCIAQHMTND
jgi:hypothetical protein